MKHIIAILALIAVAMGDGSSYESSLQQPIVGSNSITPALDVAWNSYKEVFHKDYNGDAQEELTRRLNFENAVTTITQNNLLSNLGLRSYKLGINKYSDLSPAEISKYLFGFNGPNNYPSEASPFKLPQNNLAANQAAATTAAASVDWRKKGYVTPVKDQGQCGCCYTFSSTGALEGQLKKKTGKLVSLSEQQLVDCSQSEGNQGCDGGWMNQVFKYIKKQGGIDTEDSYPYQEQVGNCSFSKDSSAGTVTGYVNIPSGDEGALMKAVATVGPLSVAINAGGEFPYYESGVYDPPVCGNTIYDLSHAPLLVGYGSENGQDYWLVKNSWGESWGIEGYIKMARNKNNLCGIATKASYPLVA